MQRTLLCAFVVAQTRVTIAAAAEPTITLAWVEAEARRHSPALATARAEAQAAREQAPAARALDDPMLAVTLWQMPIDGQTVPIMYQLTQRLPWPGTRGARGRAADHAAEAAAALARGRTAEVLLEVRRAYADYLRYDRQAAINGDTRAIVAALVDLAAGKYRLGRASQQDVLKARAELAALDNERIELDHARLAARALLATLVGQSAASELGAPEAPPDPPPLAPVSELVTSALRNRPELAALRADLERAQAELDAARRERWPEIELTGGYMTVLGGTDAVTAGLGISLPIWGRQGAQARAAEAQVAARRAELTALRLRVESEIAQARLAVETASRHVELHARTLIPLARETLRSAQAGYTQNQVDFLTLLEDVRALKMHHLEEARYRAERERQLAELARAAGMELR